MAKSNTSAMWQTPADLARLLDVDPSIISGHVDAGAPTGEDGCMHLLHYVAWLIQQTRHGKGQ